MPLHKYMQLYLQHLDCVIVGVLRSIVLRNAVITIIVTKLESLSSPRVTNNSP